MLRWLLLACITLAGIVLSLAGCVSKPILTDKMTNQNLTNATTNGKPVVYQVFTRLFGNKTTRQKPWGTRVENGVGKFNDFTATALAQIKALGVSHIWYTGVPHHAVIGDYSEIGISDDDPDVVKGRAGSPYAIKDYYNVDPDLAVEPANRMQEFVALIQRSHQAGLKVIIDIVPNHVARGYHSTSKPAGVEDFGANDDKTVVYQCDNNFYYVVGESFKVPLSADGYQPLGGDTHPLLDGQFEESPAKWTGNGSRQAQPDSNDWYETVKVNFGVRPDGSYDFPLLPQAYDQLDFRAHAAFWADKSVPNTWLKFADIARYWLAKGVDGFRYDMAEMVPVEFWSYLNSSIKTINPEAFLLAEVYNPALYRDYIARGKMDYLYDKVEFYDTIKAIIQGRSDTAALVPIQQSMADIAPHMLHFMENHDEHRIASPDFAGSAEEAKPAMVVSATISTSPTMIYFGQEVGEAGQDSAGFGQPGRTTIFDYWGVSAHQRWMNNGKFDGGQSTNSERSLRDFYQRLLNFTSQSQALTGQYAEIHTANLKVTANYPSNVFSFVRWHNQERLIIVSNFDATATAAFTLHLPTSVISQWQLPDGSYPAADQLIDAAGATHTLTVTNGAGALAISLAPLQSVILAL